MEFGVLNVASVVSRRLHWIEKTFSYEKYRPLTMRPNGFIGGCTLAFAYSKCSCDWCWLLRVGGASRFLRVAKLNNKGQFECYTVRNLQRLTSVHELKQFLLENNSEIRKYHAFPVMYENSHSLIMQMSSLNEHFPEIPWVSHFHATTFFQSSVYSQESHLRVLNVGSFTLFVKTVQHNYI